MGLITVIIWGPTFAAIRAIILCQESRHRVSTAQWPS
jgi:hypothetical protein